jgi:hypothetical protein
MRKTSIGVLAFVVGACVCVWADSWSSTAGNPQRNGWAQGETVLTREAYAAKQVKLLYKVKIANQAKGLDALTAPIILNNIIGYNGFKEPLFIGGSSDALYEVDAPIGELLATSKLDAADKVPAGAATVACPGGLTANVAMSGGSGGGGRGFGGFGRGGNVGGRPRGPAFLVGVSSDGYLRIARQQDLDVKAIPSTKFVPAGSNVSALNINNDSIYASTINGCGGPNGLYFADYTEPQSPRVPGQPYLSPASFKVTSFMTNGSGFSGTGGTAQGSAVTPAIGGRGAGVPGAAGGVGLAPAPPTGTPIPPLPVPAAPLYGQVAEGHGDVAGVYNDTVLALDPDTLQVKDYFTPTAKMPALKPGVPAVGVTPVVFPWNGKDVIVAAGRDGRLYVLDSASLGGADHHTALSMTEPIIAPDTDFSGSGIYGTFATWTDESKGNVRWLYASVHGAAKGKGAAAPTGSVVAFKVENVDGKPALTQQWVSSDVISPEGPITSAGLVYVLGTGLSSRMAKKDGTPETVAELEKMAKPAVLHVFDGDTGKEVFSSGTAATTYAHSGIALANGRVFFTTHDNTLFTYGVPFER